MGTGGLREQNLLNTRQPANEQRRVLVAGIHLFSVLILSKILLFLLFIKSIV